MKKYRLSLGVRNGIEQQHLTEIDFNDTNCWENLKRIGELDVFKRDSWLTGYIEELPEEEVTDVGTE